MTIPHGSTFLHHYRRRTVEQQANTIAAVSKDEHAPGISVTSQVVS